MIAAQRTEIIKMSHPEIKPARIIIHSQGQQSASTPQAGISAALSLLAERMRAALINKAGQEELADCAGELEGLARLYAASESPIMRKWRCRRCGKLILEYSSEHQGMLQQLCDRCNHPKVINRLIDGVPQE